MNPRRAIELLLQRNKEYPKIAEWAKEELRTIAEADDLHIAALREDGVTYGTPTWIWSVAVGDALGNDRPRRS